MPMRSQRSRMRAAERAHDERPNRCAGWTTHRHTEFGLNFRAMKGWPYEATFEQRCTRDGSVQVGESVCCLRHVDAYSERRREQGVARLLPYFLRVVSPSATGV